MFRYRKSSSFFSAAISKSLFLTPKTQNIAFCYFLSLLYIKSPRIHANNMYIYILVDIFRFITYFQQPDLNFKPMSFEILLLNTYNCVYIYIYTNLRFYLHVFFQHIKYQHENINALLHHLAEPSPTSPHEINRNRPHSCTVPSILSCRTPHCPW